MQRIPISIIITVLGLALSSTTVARQLDISSSIQRTSLLELYTSEGCSSCPPADRWLSQLKTDPRLWHQVVPVAFHVDYWDAIGWPDRFAFKAAGQRQRLYARYRRISTVYTPGLVLAGREWRSWFSRPQLEVAASLLVGKLRLRLDGSQLNGDFQPRQKNSAALVLHVARLGFGLQTQVRAGENEGRTLHHDFVVLGYRTYPMDNRKSGFQAAGEFPAPSQPATREAVAAWVSLAGDPSPIQALGGWLIE